MSGEHLARLADNRQIADANMATVTVGEIRQAIAEAAAAERERVLGEMENEGVVTWGDDRHRDRFLALAAPPSDSLDAARCDPHCKHCAEALHRHWMQEHRAAPPSDSLDVAWAEAEAALPEGWRIVEVSHLRDGWRARIAGRDGAAPYVIPSEASSAIVPFEDRYGDTPAAALRALAAALRERKP